MSENRERWERKLSEYLDGHLEEADVRGIEAWLESDDDGAALLSELHRVREAARALEESSPTEELWPGIRAAIGALPRAPEHPPVSVGFRSFGRAISRRIFVPIAPLATAALLLVVGSGLVGAAWGARSGAEPFEPFDPVDGGVPAIVAEMPEYRHYPELLRDLERGIGRLPGADDPRGAVAVDREIAAFDRAILEAAQAVAVEPESDFLRRHLGRALEGKVDFLRRVDGSNFTDSADSP